MDADPKNPTSVRIHTASKYRADCHLIDRTQMMAMKIMASVSKATARSAALGPIIMRHRHMAPLANSAVRQILVTVKRKGLIGVTLSCEAENRRLQRILDGLPQGVEIVPHVNGVNHDGMPIVGNVH